MLETYIAETVHVMKESIKQQKNILLEVFEEEMNKEVTR